MTDGAGFAMKTLRSVDMFTESTGINERGWKGREQAEPEKRKSGKGAHNVRERCTRTRDNNESPEYPTPTEIHPH